MKTKEEIGHLIEKYLQSEANEEDEEVLIRLIEKNSQIRDEFILRYKIEQAIRNKTILELREELDTLYNSEKSSNKLKEPNSIYQSTLWKAAAIILLLVTSSILIFNLTTFRDTESKDKSKLIDTDNSAKYTAQEKDGKVTKKIDQPVLTDSGTRESTTITLNHADDNQSKPPVVADASLFTESDYFESFIDNFRSPEIRIIQPKPAARFGYGTEIMFIWKYHPAGDSLYLSIYNNKEEKIHKARVISEYMLKKELKPGIYYWKLESEDDLIFMNKFYII